MPTTVPRPRHTLAYTQHCGNNPGQQDALWAGPQVFQQRNLAPSSHDSEDLCVWAAVADGVADSPRAERASRFVLQALAAHAAAGALCTAGLVRQVQAELCDALARGRTCGASTTLALAACSAERCTVVHVGDSRVYRITADGQWQQLTRDHTQLQRMIEDGEADPEMEYATAYNALEAYIAADGEETYFSIGCCSTQLVPRDALLVCTDGVHDTLGTHLQALHHPQLAPLAQVRAWRRAVLQRGAPDNFSMVLVQRQA